MINWKKEELEANECARTLVIGSQLVFYISVYSISAALSLVFVPAHDCFFPDSGQAVKERRRQKQCMESALISLMLFSFSLYGFLYKLYKNILKDI